MTAVHLGEIILEPLDLRPIRQAIPRKNRQDGVFFRIANHGLGKWNQHCASISKHTRIASHNRELSIVALLLIASTKALTDTVLSTSPAVSTIAPSLSPNTATRW